ncbi:hypothetical protein BDV95DRAFT_603328 [Massariosphaeria phaeospora]|uniref:S-adenosyl-L-methionine-dependent methyltransferase n=1 Tax=Massariosphaeria phaeospora TaxID=100035 RepID=A0A7C8ME12_9PLEO|nr:hypothetical protein BDV95DRAFT_603328 [Massariosphaeria phaeospora]
MSDDTSDNQYVLRNENELTRQHLQHAVIKDAMGGQLLFAPLDLHSSPPLRILDSCTADGTWIRDLQTSTPSTVEQQPVFVGTDIEKSYFPAQPWGNNTQYQVQNVTKPWPKEWINGFDIVHQRLALSCPGDGVATKSLIANYAEMLKPGGWIQIVELADWTSENDGPAWRDMMICLSDMIRCIGSSLEHVHRVKGWFEELGLVDVEERVVVANYGTREDKQLEAVGKEAALLTARGILPVVASFPQESLTLPKERVHQIKSELEKELGGTVSSAHWRYKVVCGRKPT